MNFYRKRCTSLKLSEQRLKAYTIFFIGIESFPEYEDGGLQIFKNFKEGYYTQEEYDKKKCPIHFSQIHDKKYLRSAIRHTSIGSTNFGHNAATAALLNEILKDEFGDVNETHKKCLLTYFRLGLKHIQKCEICGDAIMYPNISTRCCGKKICRTTLDLKEADYIDFMKDIFLHEKRSRIHIR